MKNPRSYKASLSRLAKEMVLDEIENPKNYYKALVYLSSAMHIGSIVFGKTAMAANEDFNAAAKKWRKKLGVIS